MTIKPALLALLPFLVSGCAYSVAIQNPFKNGGDAQASAEVHQRPDCAYCPTENPTGATFMSLQMIGAKVAMQWFGVPFEREGYELMTTDPDLEKRQTFLLVQEATP